MNRWKLLVFGGIAALGTTIAVMQDGGEAGPEVMVLAGKTAREIHVVQSDEIVKAKPGDEIVSKRTANSKHYKVTNNTFHAEISMTDVHYLDPADGVYKEPDLTVREVTAEAKKDPRRLYDRFVDPGNGLPKTAFFETRPWDYIFYHPDGDSVRYDALYDTQEIEAVMVYEMRTTKEYITLDSEADGSALSWLIETSAECELRGNEVYYTDDDGKFLFRNPAPWAKDADGKDIPVAVKLDHDLLTYLLDIPETAVYPITVDPSTTVQGVLDGTTESSNVVYATARNATNSTSTNTNITVGQLWNDPNYIVNRAFLTIPLDGLPNIASVSSCSLYFYVNTDGSTDDFNFLGVSSTKKSVLATSWFNDFVGWAVSGAYSSSWLTGPLNTSTFSGVGWYGLGFTPAGEDTVVARSGDSLHVALLSWEDVNESEPTAFEYFSAYGSGEAGKEPYLSITYESVIPTDFAMTAVDDDSITCTWTDTYIGEDGYRIIKPPYNGPVDYVDSVGANIETITIGGLDPNTLYTYKVQIIDAESDSTSAEDSEYTFPAEPGGGVVTSSATTNRRFYFTLNGNPSGTEHAAMVIDAAGDTSFVDFSADPDTLRTFSPAIIDDLPDWGWAQRSAIVAGDDTATVYVPNYIGEILNLYLYVRRFDE